MQGLPNLISKKELRRLLGVSQKFLSDWLNKQEYEELRKLGYRKNQKYLLRHQLEYLFPDGLYISEKNQYLLN
jgi:hypothetical protein